MDYMKDLSPELQNIAREQLNEDPTTTVDDIEHIREWLKKQPHINARTDDRIILRFLRGCKFSLQKTKDKLEMYYTCRGLIPEWFSNRDPLDPKMRRILELGEFLPLNECDNQGRKIIIIRPGIHDPALSSMEEVFNVSQMIFDIMVDEDISCSVAGFVHILDVKAISPTNVFQMTPAIMKKAIKIWQLHFHGSDVGSLHQHFPKDALPIDYGGTGCSIEDITKQWLEKVSERRAWLLDDEKYKADESKRPGKMKTRLDLFGIEGSFKKLNVD